jgi:hypothetical protein
MIRYQNIAPVERYVRVFLGVMCFIFWDLGSLVSPLWAGLAVVLSLSGISGISPLYTLLGVSTWPARSRPR